MIFGLALAAGFWSFRGRNRPEVDALFVAGFVLVTALIIFVVVLRYFGGHLTRFLPARFRELYERFHEGSTGAMRPRVLLQVGAVTAAVWLLEGARVLFVIRALDLPAAHNIGISSAIFVALGASLLTAIPLTPAGIGFVQDGVVALLYLYGVPADTATAVALVDFVISTLSVIVIGGVVYAFSRQGAPGARGLQRPDRPRLIGAASSRPLRIGTFRPLEGPRVTAILRLLGRTTGEPFSR